MSDLVLIAKIYARLQYERDSHFTQAMRAEFPKGSKMLAEFLSGHLNHTYELAKSDFYDVKGASNAEVNAKPSEHDVYSFVFLNERPEAPALGKVARRHVRIHLNVGKTNSGEPLNTCWRRFCILKEVCQAIVYEEFSENSLEAYPKTIRFPQISSLFEKINNEPFSLWDFDDKDYDRAHFTENAAELLALGMLYPFDHALEHQKELQARAAGDLTKSDLMEIAKYYKIPKRYVELMMTWAGLNEFVAIIESFADSLD